MSKLITLSNLLVTTERLKGDIAIDTRGVEEMLLISVVYFESLDGSEADSTVDTDISSMPEDPGDEDGTLEEEDEVQQKPPLRY